MSIFLEAFSDELEKLAGVRDTAMDKTRKQNEERRSNLKRVGKGAAVVGGTAAGTYGLYRGVRHLRGRQIAKSYARATKHARPPTAAERAWYANRGPRPRSLG